MSTSEWSCPSLKCEAKQCGAVRASRDSVAVSKDDAGSPSCVNCEANRVEQQLVIFVFKVRGQQC